MTVAPALFDRSFVSPETYDAFFVVVGRLEACLDAEAAALSKGRHDDLVEITRQKSQGFLELNRIMHAMERTIPSQDVIARLTMFKTKLDANGTMLTTHLKAAQEVTGIIMRVMHDSESDGTYSRGTARMAYDCA